MRQTGMHHYSSFWWKTEARRHKMLCPYSQGKHFETIQILKLLTPHVPPSCEPRIIEDSSIPPAIILRKRCRELTFFLWKFQPSKSSRMLRCPNGCIIAQEMDLQGDKYDKSKCYWYLKKETPQLPLTQHRTWHSRAPWKDSMCLGLFPIWYFGGGDKLSHLKYR